MTVKMHSNLIVARMNPQSSAAIAELFNAFDTTDMPHRMGTQRRQLFTFHGLYFHLQDFHTQHSTQLIEQAKTDPQFKHISEELKPYIQPYDPTTWHSPTDAMAQRFYYWEPK